MDLISWGLSAMDSIFSVRKPSPSEPDCPEGTFPAGYIFDYYKSWTPVCLGILNIEDVEDLVICILLVIGEVLIGSMLLIIYRKVRKPTGNLDLERPVGELRASLAEIGKATAINSGMCAHKFNEMGENIRALRQELGVIKATAERIQEKLCE